MSNIRLKGALLDDKTRCVHYHSPLDVVALQCYHCRTFYPCFECHNEQEDHTFMPWPKNSSTRACDFMWCVAHCTRLRHINR